MEEESRARTNDRMNSEDRIVQSGDIEWLPQSCKIAEPEADDDTPRTNHLSDQSPEHAPQ